MFLKCTFTLKCRDHDLFLKALLASFADNNVLVLRMLLDILITHAPLKLMWSILGENTILVTSSIASLLLRKDLSLSRRVFQWIIGEDSSDVPELTIRTVSEALLLMLRERSSSGKTLIRFFKVMICILDKPEISLHLIASKVIIKSVVLLSGSHASPSQDDAKAVEQASLFFEMIDASHFWNSLGSTIESTKDPSTLLDICKCIHFCLSNFHMYDPQIQSTIFPALFLNLSMKASECKSFSREYAGVLTKTTHMHIIW